jgi:hypothetical protein
VPDEVISPIGEMAAVRGRVCHFAWWPDQDGRQQKRKFSYDDCKHDVLHHCWAVVGIDHAIHHYFSQAKTTL